MISNKPKNIIFTLLMIAFFCQGIAYSEVAITVYNQDLALVRESREFDLDKGMQEIKFVDVAARIIPSSVHFSAKGVSLVEQNFEYDLVDARKLTQKYLDNKIEIYTVNGDFFSGVLLAASDALILREKDNTVRAIAYEKILTSHYPSLPDGLITRPTLVWVVNSDKSAKREGEVSYLTNGISWTAEYVAVTDKNDNTIELTGWTNIENNSGKTYEDAQIKLMAGDVQILRDNARRGRGKNRPSLMIESSNGSQFEEQAFYEYHLYTLQRSSTVKNNQIKQISLFPAADVKTVKKEYRYSPSSDPSKVSVTLSFKNDKDNNLAIPLPAGKIRVYKEGAGGSLEFVGEDRIDHTPKNEKVKISTGNAFDIIGERKQLDRQRKGNGRETEYEVSVRNHKDEPIEVIVTDRFWGDWSVVHATDGWKKVSAREIEWIVKLKPDEVKVINYRVLVE